MPAPSLDQALTHYQTALQDWQQTTPQSEATGLAVLQARDTLQETLQVLPLRRVSTLMAIQKLDRTLAEQATDLDAALSFEQYRKSFLPESDRWWWFLDQTKPPHPLDRYDWLFNSISLGAWTVSLALLVDISRRFLLAGSGVQGLSIVTLSSLLTLLKARSDLTDAGKQGFGILLEKLGVKSYWQAEATCGTTALLSLSLAILWLQLPNLSRHYNRLGQGAQDNGELGKAEQLYNQAIALDEDNLDAHYNLGTLYEDLQDTEQATDQYLMAIQGDLPDAYNNLAHLYIQAATQTEDATTQAQNQHQAIAFLSQGLQLAELQNSPPWVKYSLYKNLGWARLLQEQPQVAQPLLENAIAISEQESPNNVLNAGSAYCLLAHSLEAQDAPALTSWQRCCQLATSANPNEDAWILEAQAKLKAENYNPNTVCRPNATPVS